MMSVGQETFENETTERLSRAKSYVVDVREIDPNRIVTVDGFAQKVRNVIRTGSVPPAIAGGCAALTHVGAINAKCSQC